MILGLGALITIHGIPLGHYDDDPEPAIVVAHDGGHHTHEEDRSPIEIRIQQQMSSTSASSPRVVQIPGGKVSIDLDGSSVVYELGELTT